MTTTNKKTLYVKTDDLPVWDRAAALATSQGTSVSELVVTLLRQHSHTKADSLTDQLCGDYLDADPDRLRAYHHDPRYHADFQLLRRALDLVDTLLVDAHYPPSQRRELLGVLLAGPPDPAAALARLRDHAERVAALEHQPPAPFSPRA